MAATTDDWKVNIKPAEKFSTPTFIRLFIINRVVNDHFSKQQGATNYNIHNAVRSLLADVFENKNDQASAFTVVSRLVNVGIKTYMNQFCEEKHYNIIEQIFNKLILPKFDQEYANIATYNDQQEYKSMVFSSSDLMCLIFQFLNYFRIGSVNDLSKCSLVCSNWLYHSFNPNATFGVVIIDSTLNKDKTHRQRSKQSRFWQRAVNARCLNIIFSPKAPKPDEYLLSHVLTLGNIEQIDGIFFEDYVLVLQAAMQQCCDKIKIFKCDIRIFSQLRENEFPILSPLKLLNCEIIQMTNLYFYILWSNKCCQLTLRGIQNIDKNWCNFVIDNCDCSNIEHLSLGNVKFESNVDQAIVSKLAQKLVHLKKLDITIWDRGVEKISVFWQSLKPMIEKNNTYVAISASFSSPKSVGAFENFIHNYKIKINKIYFTINSFIIQSISNMIAKNNELESIDLGCGSSTISNVNTTKEFFQYWQNALKIEQEKIENEKEKEKGKEKKNETEKEKFKLSENKIDADTMLNQDIIVMTAFEKIQLYQPILRLQMLETNDLINELIKIINQLENGHAICIFLKFVIHRFGDLVDKDVDDFLISFKKFWESIKFLIRSNGVGVNVELMIVTPREGSSYRNKMKQVFSSVFDNDESIATYKRPKCNHYCKPLHRLITNVTIKNDKIIQLFCRNCESKC